MPYKHCAPTGALRLEAPHVLTWWPACTIVQVTFSALSIGQAIRFPTTGREAAGNSLLASSLAIGPPFSVTRARAAGRESSLALGPLRFCCTRERDLGLRAHCRLSDGAATVSGCGSVLFPTEGLDLDP